MPDRIPTTVWHLLFSLFLDMSSLAVSPLFLFSIGFYPIAACLARLQAQEDQPSPSEHVVKNRKFGKRSANLFFKSCHKGFCTILFHVLTSFYTSLWSFQCSKRSDFSVSAISLAFSLGCKLWLVAFLQSATKGSARNFWDLKHSLPT